MEKVAQEFTDMLEAPGNHRIYAIQGAGVASDIMEKLDLRLIRGIHDQVRRKEIVIDGIISESVFALFQRMSVDQLESHVGRMTIVYVLPDELLDFPFDVFVAGRVVLLVDYAKESSIKIEDPGLSQVFSSLFLLAEQQGRRVDLNSHIQRLVGQRKKASRASL